MRSLVPTLAACIAVSLATTTVWADVVGVYQNGKNASDTMTIYYRDDQNVKVDVGDGSYMLVTGSNAYMVQQQGSGMIATDMDEMGAMLKQSGLGAGNMPTADASMANVQIKKTGRSESVAGYEGEVFEVTSDGKTTEYVGSSDKDIVALNRAFLVMGKRMSQSFGRNDGAAMDRAVKMAQAQGMGGMLRSGDDMHLASVTKKDLGSGFYKLPAGTTIQAIPNMAEMGGPNGMPNMGEIMRQAQDSANQGQVRAQQQQQQQQQHVDDARQQVDPATGIAKSAADAAQQETENQVRESVQNAIRGLFGR